MIFFNDIDGVRGFVNLKNKWFFNDIPESNNENALRELANMLK
jgi:hypothetical protein